MSMWLVTGGAGFIGSHLCDALLSRGDSVRVLDNLSTGRRSNLPAGVPLTVADIADPDAMGAAVREVDGCFHLAAIASVERGVRDWLGTHRANLTGTVTLFEALRRVGSQAPVVYASSAAVYGDCTTVPITEAAPTRPLSAYGADKLGCELHARVASHVHGIPTVGLRFFNVYGPRQDPRSPYSGVISIFCDRISCGQPVDVFGDGLQTRDFIYVGDVVAGLLAAMDLRPADAPVFNLCTGRPTSVLDLGQTIATLAGMRADMRHQPPRAGEIRHSVGAPDAAHKVLALRDTAVLADGLRHVLNWAATAN